MIVELNVEDAGILTDVLNRLRQDEHIPPSGYGAEEIQKISELYYQIDKNRRDTFYGGLPFQYVIRGNKVEAAYKFMYAASTFVIRGRF